MHIYCFSEAEDNATTVKPDRSNASLSLSLFLPLLESFGTVEEVFDFDLPLQKQCLERLSGGEKVCLIAFTLPHNLPDKWPCPIIPLFPWGYSSVPGAEHTIKLSDMQDARSPQQASWLAALKNSSQLITQSDYARNILEAALNNSLNVSVVPTPSYDQWRDVREETLGSPPVRVGKLNLSQVIFDSLDLDLAPETIFPRDKCIPTQQTRIPDVHDISRIDLDFGKYYSGILSIGFYKPEGWGMWSRSLSPWIVLPYQIQGRVRVKISMTAFGPNIGRAIEISIGDDKATVVPHAEISDFEFDLEIGEPGNTVCFDNLSRTNRHRADDPRTLGVGIAELSIQALDGSHLMKHKRTAGNRPNQLTLSGVNYIASIDPIDDKDNWKELITAFCIALRNMPNATLILLIEHPELHDYIDDIFELWCALSPFECRFVLVHGRLNKDQEENLVRLSTYIANSSSGEGECLPLMNFMSSGIPAIAPNHTAMGDYISQENAFVYDSSPEPCAWPQDRQSRFYSNRYRLNWESLLGAFQESYEVATHTPERYYTLSTQAARALESHCSAELTLARLRAILENV